MVAFLCAVTLAVAAAVLLCRLRARLTSLRAIATECALLACIGIDELYEVGAERLERVFLRRCLSISLTEEVDGCRRKATMQRQPIGR